MPNTGQPVADAAEHEREREPEACGESGGSSVACGDQGDDQTLVCGFGSPLFSSSCRDGMFDEIMAAASRAGKVVVTGHEELLSATLRKTPHVTLGACFNFRGDSPSPLVAPQGPRCALGELAASRDEPC